MSTGGYKIFDQGGMYFVSFAVVDWVDVFIRKEYREILIESSTLPAGTTAYNLWMVHYEQSRTLNNFCQRK